MLEKRRGAHCDKTPTFEKLVREEGIIQKYIDEHYLQPNVSRFFLYLKALGYKVIYLTARPISTINATRKCLVDDYDEFVCKKFEKLPDGPVFTSCDGRIRTTINYVGVATGLGGTSHYDFKFKYLKKIRELFHVTRSLDSPLFAGFGNTETDEESYRNVGISDDRIFIITKKGNSTGDPHRFTSYDGLLSATKTETDEESYRNVGISDDRIFIITKKGNSTGDPHRFTSYDGLLSATKNQFFPV